MNGHAGWTQVLAAVVAAVIPVLVKVLNDWHDRVTAPAVTKPSDGPAH